MKTLKILTLIAVTGATGLMAGNAQQRGDCNHQYRTSMDGQTHQTQMHKKHKRKNPNQRINRLLRKLDLTEAQKTQLKEIRKSMHQARKIQKKELRGSMNLKKFVSVDGFDKEGFIAASESRSKKMAKNRAEMMEKLITVLTPEQRIALVEKLNRQKKGKRHQAK
jgi:Spy/CpxP family protein refolding chaperone